LLSLLLVALQDITIECIVRGFQGQTFLEFRATDDILEALVLEHQPGGHEAREAIEIQGLAVVL